MVADSSLSAEVQERLTPLGVLLDFAPGQQLFREGESHPYLYLVRSGRFALSRIGRSGRRSMFWILGEGGSFGLSHALTDEPIAGYCECLDAGQVVRIDKQALVRMIDHDETVRWAVLHSLSQRVCLYNIALQEERMLPLTVRLGRRLVQICGNDNRVNMSHSDLADFVGASRYAVGKVLRDFQAQGYVNVRYGHIEIADHQGMSNYLAAQSDLG